MPVTIEFEANLTKVRADVDKFIAETKAKVTALNFGMGGGGAIAPTIGGEPAPTIERVFGAGALSGGSRARIAGAFGAIDQLTIPGFAAPFAQGGFFASSPLAYSGGFAGMGPPGPGGFFTGALVPTAGNVLGTPAVVGGGGAALGGAPMRLNIPSGGGGGGLSFSGGFAGRGWGRIVGGGYLAREALQLAEAGREYNIATVLAGNDQEAQLQATLAYRNRVLSFPLVGQAVRLLEDPGGYREAGIQATLRGARAQDVQTESMRTRSLASERLRDAEALAGERRPYERQVLAARQRFAEQRRAIDDRVRAAAATDRGVLDEEAAQLEADRPNLANRAALADRSRSYSAAYEAAFDQLTTMDNAQVAAHRQKLDDQRRKAFDKDYRSLENQEKLEMREYRREEDFRGKLATGIYGYTALGAVAATIGDSSLERRAKLSAENFAAFTKAGQDRAGFGEFLSLFGARAAVTFANIAEEKVGLSEAERARQLHQTDVTEQYSMSAGARAALLRHDPLSAAMIDIDRRERSRLREDDVRGREDSPAYKAIQADFAMERKLRRMEDEQDKAYRRMSLTTQARSLSLVLQDAPIGAEANEIAGSARLRARQLRDRGDPDNAKMELQNAILQEQVLRKEYLQKFRPQEVDLQYMAINAPRGGEDTVKVMEEIKTEIQGLRQDLSGGVAAGD